MISSMKQKLFALFAAAVLLLGMSACKNEDNPSSGWGDNISAPAQLKQGIWTEYDEALLTSGKYTAEELAAMPTVGIKIEGDKGYFFTYTADDVSEPVEGQISYDKSTGKGTITFPTIADSPLSDQKVNFTATTDETLEFELTYEGQKTTATCAWLCETLDNWNWEITDEDWKELMAYYEQYAADAGPDASIDWSDSDVEGLAEPLVWDEDALAPAKTRAIATGTIIFIGAQILGALFEEEKPDPSVEINKRLDIVTRRLDQVLGNQEKMMEQIDLQFNQMDQHFSKVNERLIAIANKMKHSDAVKIFNDRNSLYYNPLKVQNQSYFDAAYKLYNDNKSDLSKVSTTLGEYGKEWVGNNEEYLKLTWQYIEYLTTVQHPDYGTGMDKIYDGLTFDKYPWEHLATADRLSYRSYDMFMITKCLFMICLYANYCDLSDIKKEGIYNNYDIYKDKFLKFSMFKATDPDKFRVCQIPGAHFVMHKEIQKYNYKGKNNEAPHPAIYGKYAIYRPEWHEAGSIRIECPYTLKSKLISVKEALALYDYYRSAVYPKGVDWDGGIQWIHVLVSGDKSAGAVLAMQPEYSSRFSEILLLSDTNFSKYDIDGVESTDNALWIGPTLGIATDQKWKNANRQIGFTEAPQNGKALWRNNGNDYLPYNYYAAIVAERFD